MDEQEIVTHIIEIETVIEHQQKEEKTKISFYGNDL